MKKINLVPYVLTVFSIIAIVFIYKSSSNKENPILTLNVISYSNKSLIATDNNSGIKYQIFNSQSTITDNKGNILSWNGLKDAKVIEVHYSGKIKEVSPAIFEKIIQIVFIS